MEICKDSELKKTHTLTLFLFFIVIVLINPGGPQPCRV